MIKNVLSHAKLSRKWGRTFRSPAIEQVGSDGKDDPSTAHMNDVWSVFIATFSTVISMLLVFVGSIHLDWLCLLMEWGLLKQDIRGFHLRLGGPDQGFCRPTDWTHAQNPWFTGPPLIPSLNSTTQHPPQLVTDQLGSFRCGFPSENREPLYW